LEDYDNALLNLNKAIALKKDYAYAYQEIGYAYKKKEKFADAETALKKSIALKPDYAMAYKQLGDVYSKQKRNAEAIEAYKTCYSYDNKSEEACYQIGYLNNGEGNYVLALEWLQKAIAISPATSTYNEIGFAYYKQKKNEEAIAAYKKALELTPTNGTAYKGMGDVYRRNYSPAKVDEAMESYKKAIANNPKSAGSHFGLGWCYNEKKNYSEAMASLQKSLELDVTLVAAYTELGYAQYMTDKNTEALNTFKKGLQYDNKNTLCRYYSGLVYIVLKDKTNALAMYTELKSIDASLATKLKGKIDAM
jgi:superkiller protein 3